MGGPDVDRIVALVGAVSPEQLRYIDCFTSEHLGLFMPVGGACLKALTPLHTHPAYMFVLNFDDRTSITIHGCEMPGQHGRVFYLSPDIPHQEMPSDDPPRYIAALIEPAFFDAEAGTYPDAEGLSFEGVFHDPSPELLPLFRRFMIEAHNKVAGSDAVLHALGVEICHALIRAAIPSAPVNDPVSGRIEIDGAIAQMHASLGRKVTVADLAAWSHMSASHFSRLFREETGQSPMAYLRGIRLERAKKLLLAGHMTNTEVALECGLGSGAYLCASFKEAYNVTPSEYRERGQRSVLSRGA